MSDFINCSPIDFTVKSEVERLQGALKDCEDFIQSKKLHAELLIAGKKFKGHEQISSIDPSDASSVLGLVELANDEQAENAVRTLLTFEDPWRKFPATERIQFLKNLGQIMCDKRFELTALIIREAGKPWKEADADVVEAIDFCFYYAMLAEDLFLNKKLTQKVIGEQNLLSYSGRGLSLVIAPWNFPLAILCGMTVAALVSGNVTIIKPAEQTSLIAAAFAECLLEAGFPENSFAFLPGRGEIIGRYLVAHSAVKLICFTGSKNVGLEIIEKAAHVQAGQNHIKRVIAELGGKNCIIVDSDADYDEALKGIIYSAFGFAGQKCSACSRLIVVGTSYETLMDRLAESCKDLIVGSASDPSTFLGPVVDLESQKRIQVTLASLDQEPFFQGQTPSTGCFIPATIYKDVSLTSKLWLQELFAPVLACINVKTFDEALKLANSAEYALTGGVYSRSPKNIEQAIRDFEVGNLYINRACTGAIVCRHPFGGYKLSGIGSKAGGPDYLQQFVVPRTVSENTMRRGFTPELL